MDNKINNAGEFILGLAGVIFERFDITSRPSPLSVARVTRKGFVKSSAHVLVISRRVHSLFAVDLCSFRGPQVYLTSRKLCPYAWKKTYKTNSDKENISLDKETIYIPMIDLIIFLPKESFPLPLSKDMESANFRRAKSDRGKMKFHSYPLVSKTSRKNWD